MDHRPFSRCRSGGSIQCPSLLGRWSPHRVCRPLAAGNKPDGEGLHFAPRRRQEGVRPQLARTDRSAGIRWRLAAMTMWIEVLCTPVRPLRALPFVEPKWRNGRRGRLKIGCPQGRVSSILTFGTTLEGVSHAFRVRSPVRAPRAETVVGLFPSQPRVPTLGPCPTRTPRACRAPDPTAAASRTAVGGASKRPSPLSSWVCSSWSSTCPRCSHPDAGARTVCVAGPSTSGCRFRDGCAIPARIRVN
jgi:hypothetical protein